MQKINFDEAVARAMVPLAKYNPQARSRFIEFPFGKTRIYIQSGWKKYDDDYPEAWNMSTWKGPLVPAKLRTWRLIDKVPRAVIEYLDKASETYRENLSLFNTLRTALDGMGVKTFVSGSYGHRMDIGRGYVEGYRTLSITYFLGGATYFDWHGEASEEAMNDVDDILSSYDSRGFAGSGSAPFLKEKIEGGVHIDDLITIARLLEMNRIDYSVKTFYEPTAQDDD